MASRQISKYHLVVGLTYAVISTCFIFSTPGAFNYLSITLSDLGLFSLITILCFLSLYLCNRLISFGKIALNKKTLKQSILLIIYAFVLFALPEEIIFRWFIQGRLQEATFPFAAILISSLIYGIAHIFNGSKGLKPQEWNWKLVAITSVAGIFLGWIYFETQSLILAISLHGLLIIANQLFIKEINTKI